MLNVKIKTIKTADIDAVVALYQDAGWWEDNYVAEEFIPQVVKQSCCFVGAFLPDGSMIGMGRAIADGISDAYIQDIAVLTAYRKHGIGSMIIRHIITHLRELDIDWIGLIGEPGTGSFYRKLGFKELKNFIPMKLEINQ
jgi:aralkylamine N-acetyltransferase